MRTLARKPARLQASWAAYSGTTGLPQIDYILADRWVIPEPEESFYVEQIERLPEHYVCFDVPSEDIAPRATVQAKGTFTFGCFNNRPKISSSVVDTWAAILRRCSQAELFLKTPSLGDDSVGEDLLEEFSQHGVERERIRIEGHSPRKELLTAYQQVDLCLDPFPFNGGVTTVESLWMGVPVLTVKGDRFVGHASGTFLRAVGLETLLAGSLVAYVNTACRLAQSPPLISQLRDGLRDRVLASPLCNHAQFTRHLEQAYQRMWMRFVQN